MSYVCSLALGHQLTQSGGPWELSPAAAHARRRRTVKHLVSGGAVTAAGVALLLALRQPPGAPRIATENPVTVSSFEIMSDEELLAELKDQPVLFLKNETGITGVVFLVDAALAPSNHPSRGLGLIRR